MNRKHLGQILSGFLLLLAIPACALPGRTAQPASVVNAKRTAVALTSTAGALANLNTATPSPIPTETIVPTPKISLAGTSLIEQQDQSYSFIDHTAGIQLAIPAGWMPIRVNEEEYYKAFSSDVVLQNPPISEHLTAIQNVKPDILRLDAIDIRPGHIPNGIITNVNVIFEAGDVRSLEKWEQAERNRKSPYKKYRFVSSSYPQTANGTKVLLIEEHWAAAGDKGTIYYRGIFFPLPTGTIVLDFFTDSDFKDTVLPDFEQIVNSLAPLTP
jgi:hypothetical protein